MKTIFDIPDKIFVQIILYLTPRERLPLSKSCKRFNSLVFEDEETLRYLDFSKSGHFIEDVEEYLDKERTCELIRGVNLNNDMIADRLPDTFIAKAINLVEINFLGTRMDIRRLEALLNPLQQVKRLSFKWRESANNINIVDDHHVILQQRFHGLIYLSVDTMFSLLKPLVSLLKMCQELRELYIVGNRCMFDENPTLPEEFPLPESIEVVDYAGFVASRVKRRIREFLTNPEEWTDFRMELCCANKNRKFHIERNVQVCHELIDIGTIECVRYDPANNLCNLGRVLIPSDLLREVVTMRDRHAPKEFCCLSKSGSLEGSCSLTIRDAKKLLGDSSYQLSSLHLRHRVELNCDVHLIASAFPYLTELHLSGIRSKESTRVERDSMDPDSSFARLVRSTPRLRHLTLEARGSDVESKHCDFDGLGLISGWKHLETLFLSGMPLGDGRFLVEIARQCKNLKNIHLSDRVYPPIPNVCYEERVLDMLKSCENLRNVSILGYSLSKPSQMFNLLKNKSIIETIELGFMEYEDTPDNLTSCIEQMLDQCSQLTRFNLKFKDVDKELERAFQRLNDEQNRRSFEMSFNHDFLYLVRGQLSHRSHQVIRRH